MSFTVQVVGKSDIGCIRTNNEDNFGFDARFGIYVVCDGMGGQAAGEVASKLAVDTVLDYFREAARTGVYATHGRVFSDISSRGNHLASAVQLANGMIYEAAGRTRDHAGMGSTIAAVIVENNFYSVCHVGDSRVYLMRKGEIKQLTNDHSLVMEQVRRGLMTLEEAEKSEMQNIIIRALGSEPTVEPDLDDFVAQHGDTLLLASDGLTKLVRAADLLKIVQSAPSMDHAVDAMIQAAKNQGGDDNITVLLIRFLQVPWYRRLFGGGNHTWQNSI
jgi:serine/threonine protein phosphatase PrpC